MVHAQGLSRDQCSTHGARLSFSLCYGLLGRCLLGRCLLDRCLLQGGQGCACTHLAHPVPGSEEGALQQTL